MRKSTTDVIVVGGGPAGMLAAVTAARRGLHVLLLEKNDRPGKKLCITGKGRCNVTNDCAPDVLLKQIPRNSRFLYSSIYGFTAQDTMAFFEENGCALKVERGNRVFPVSDRAADILQALRTAMQRAGVQQRQETVRGVLTQDGAVAGVKTAGGLLSCGCVILCTGGMSYPLTGSTGDGYAMARALGHTIVAPQPSLVPLESDDPACAAMQGLSLRNTGLGLREAGGKLIYQDFGELLFTHFGVSGPMALSASAHMNPAEQYRLELDLKPALDEVKLDARLLRDLEQYQNRSMENALADLFPHSLIPVMLSRCAIPMAQQANALTRKQRRALVEQTKRFVLEIRGLRPIEEAIVTRGGISVREINPKTMESKRVPGLYFAGEVIDCDAYTGGFNLQIAWSTAHAAGSNCMRKPDFSEQD